MRKHTESIIYNIYISSIERHYQVYVQILFRLVYVLASGRKQHFFIRLGQWPKRKLFMLLLYTIRPINFLYGFGQKLLVMLFGEIDQFYVLAKIIKYTFRPNYEMYVSLFTS